MKVPDANLLIHAVDEESPQHRPARDWLDGELSGGETVAFTWPVLLAFLRLTTNARVFEQPLGPGEALDIVDGGLGRPTATVIGPGERHARLLRELLASSGTAGNLPGDAHLAATVIEHGATLCSADRDFARWSGLRFVNPLDR
ncbi:MAG TPA: type II toxin-antitoxin system VapC family toxin [Acidimicrobiia bacterium]|nr:type II toxin-antitoxin system VapC family toxin [Acidimicrobiia bacterium]